MIPIHIEVEENEYDAFMALLKSLRYIKIEQSNFSLTSSNQVQCIKAILEKAPNSLFQDLKDPLEWQRNIRDEWA